MSTDKLANRWIELKTIIQQAQKELDGIKSRFDYSMEKQNLNDVEGPNYIVRRKLCKRESVSTKDLPDDIRQKYKQVTKYNLISITEKKGQKK